VKRALVMLALSACSSSSQIGPYVKSVARNGAYLAVHKCMIVLVGETLEEGECTLEHVPLGTLPVAPYPAMQMRPAPGPAR
jgi:hypothetical protein